MAADGPLLLPLLFHRRGIGGGETATRVKPTTTRVLAFYPIG